MRRIVIGIMGPGETATGDDCDIAARLGEAVAERGWIVLTGGRPVGVMEAALRGAKRRNGLTIGILPGSRAEGASSAADVRIVSGLGEARNVINVLSSDVVCVCGMSAGTASEVALALKIGRPTVLIAPSAASDRFWRSLASPALHVTSTVDDAVRLIERLTAAATADQPS
jgi:uncharacterized protein (TIGR00725 family)